MTPTTTTGRRAEGHVGDGTITGGPSTIQQVQNDAMAPGTAVSLSGVIVTAIDSFGTKTGNIWVEEPEGGAFSGVAGLRWPDEPPSLSSRSVTSSTSRGPSRTSSRSTRDTVWQPVTELGAGPNGMTITKTGTGTVPAPMVVDALAIGQMTTQAARDAEWEKWEGVLITVNHVSAFGTPKCIGTGCTATTPEQKFSVTGDLVAESNLAAFPTTGIALNACLGSITGVGDYFFDYLILPRTTAEVTTGGTGCPAQENALTANACTDGIDNDGNGFMDCNDLGCEVGVNAFLGTSCAAGDAMCGCSKNLPSGTSVSQVNANFGTTGSPAYLHDVFVTAIASGTMPNKYWVADSLQAAPNGGVLVFSAPPSGLMVGQKLPTLQGIAGPFGTAAQKTIEISNATAGTPVAGGTVLPISNATAAQVSSLAAGATYAGSLVKLTQLKVKVAGNSFNQVVLVDNSNTTITMDDDAFFAYGGTSSAPTPPALGTCFASVTGVMDLQTTDQIRTINPRGTFDLVAGTGCTGN